MKLEGIDYIFNLPSKTARDLLLEVAEIDKDPEVKNKIGSLLAILEE